MLPEQLFLTLPLLLPEQDELQPPVPTVLGSIDYRTWRQRLERIDEILRASRVEEAFVRLCLKRRLAEWKQRAEREGRFDEATDKFISDNPRRLFRWAKAWSDSCSSSHS